MGILHAPAYPGIFLWPSVNKIQLFSAMQMQPLAVRLCNNHTRPLGPDIPGEAKRKVKALTAKSLRSNTHCPLGLPLGYSHPDADPHRETSPALAFQVLLGSAHLASGSLKEDLPPTDCEALGKSLPPHHGLLPRSLCPLHPPTLASLPALSTFTPPALDTVPGRTRCSLHTGYMAAAVCHAHTGSRHLLTQELPSGTPPPTNLKNHAHLPKPKSGITSSEKPSRTLPCRVHCALLCSHGTLERGLSSPLSHSGHDPPAPFDQVSRRGPDDRNSTSASGS